MSPTVAPLLAAALLAADPRPAPPPAPPPAGPAEAALVRCWASEVTAACVTAEKHGDDAAFEACKAERAKKACAAERAAYEKELAAGLAADALELLAASVRRVCAAESATPLGGRVPPEQQQAIADGWRQALEVRSEFMRACERSGRDARDCDDAANEAERRARAESCPTGR